MILDGRVRGFGRGGRVWGRPQKVNLERKRLDTEDEGESSCEKLWGVSAVLLVVAVCQNTLQKLNLMQTYRNQNFGPPEYIRTPRSVGHPRLGPTELPINHPRWPLCSGLDVLLICAMCFPQAWMSLLDVQAGLASQ